MHYNFGLRHNSNNFKETLSSLLERDVHLLSLRDMGFPSKWELLPVWR